ncbi:MAG: hypothetical protein CVU54_08325 [Deltaproteobacteria bacterium HGW-Deltaproteobacteria-12]|nr:MAG: hypothetical protein CVU54_08325 [Deltaproteobacteria bacterium HGW-Deltaproteobacteria-12]
MDITDIVKIVSLYILVASGETLNGIARTVYLNKRIGTRKAKRISMLSGLLLCLLICYLYVPQMNINSDKNLLFLGISLSLFMLTFDIVLGRFVMKAKWSTILAELNIFRGNLLAVGAIVMAFCPLLSSKIPRFF